MRSSRLARAVGPNGQFWPMPTLLSVVFLLASCTGSGGATPSASSGGATPSARPATIGVSKVSLGQVLVDERGRSLYLFEADTATQSTCSGACAKGWPPFLTIGIPTVTGGAMASLVGTTTRTDGSTQVTYKGHPLYFFVGDSRAGDINGEGSQAFGAGWDLVSPAGKKVEKAGA